MKVLGLITARGQSKSIPKKNIAPLADKPLLAYTCEAALRSRSIARVVLSTDDPEIAERGRECGVEVPFFRPVELALDDSPSIDVAIHAIQWLAAHERWRADALILLQPTSPLRTARHIDEAYGLFETHRPDTVVSVVEVPHRYSPYSVMRIEDNQLRFFWQEPLPFDRFRRQEVPVLYARNGPAVLIAKADLIVHRRTFYGENVVPYIMDERDSIDIDSLFDLELAEWCIHTQRTKDLLS